MKALIYRFATPEDSPALTENRIEFFREITGPASAEAEAQMRAGLLDYFREAIGTGEYTCVMALDGDRLVGTGGMIQRRAPGNFKNPSGREGYIMNIFTVPSHRGQGIARQIMERLISHGKAQGISFFQLHATQMAHEMYLKMGFYQHSEPTLRLFV